MSSFHIFLLLRAAESTIFTHHDSEPLSLSLSHACTHTHTHSHTHTHTYSSTCLNTHMHAHTLFFSLGSEPFSFPAVSFSLNEQICLFLFFYSEKGTTLLNHTLPLSPSPRTCTRLHPPTLSGILYLSLHHATSRTNTRSHTHKSTLEWSTITCSHSLSLTSLQSYSHFPSLC